MIQSCRAEPPPEPEPEPDPNLSSEFDSDFLLPLDPLFVSRTDQTHPDLGLFLDDYDDLELTFDGLDESYFPNENEPFLIPSVSADQDRSGNFTPQSEGSGISGDRGPEDVEKYLNCWPSESGGCILESPQVSGELSSEVEKGLNVSSPVSSQGSGNCGSGVSEAAKTISPDLGYPVVNQKIKVEETGTHLLNKRKQEDEDKSEESRSSKYLKSTENADSCAATGEEDEKRKSRLMRNRESAQLSRQRKKHYVDELEEKIRCMHSTIADLNGKISYFMAENSTLRQQLGGGGGMCPPPHPPVPGVYMAPSPYQCMPFLPYVVKSQGSQLPLIPIPRLKPQQSLQASKAKNSQSKKTESRSKKVASICFLGILLFIFLFGGLAPILNFKYEGTTDSYNGGYRSNYVTHRLYNQHRGRVLAVDGHLGLANGDSKIGLSDNNEVNSERRYGGESGRPISCNDKSVPVSNHTEPLAASLFVPRNDKLVKIDGNLIIHSVLASEKAMALKDSETNKQPESGAASGKNFSPALTGLNAGRDREAVAHLYRTSKNEHHQKALSAGAAENLKDHFKSTAADGKMQQWFREGIVGPMLSSGMCTEVFQFDVSPKPGSVVPVSTTSNVSTQQNQNATNINNRKNRRILHNLPIPLPRSDSNVTKNQTKDTYQNQNFGEPKPASSMVVSVLIDPREGGDGEIDGMMGPKPLSRIFVVVLLDGVKYVTYSCVLPGSGGPPLVTT